MDRNPPPVRADYPVLCEIPSRWLDNDIYGHINNVNYYSFFDTAIAHYLIREGGLDPWRAEVIGYCVESGCRFHKGRPLPRPDHRRPQGHDARPLQRPLRDRHLSQRRRPGGGRRLFRARLRRARERASGAHPRTPPGRARAPARCGGLSARLQRPPARSACAPLPPRARLAALTICCAGWRRPGRNGERAAGEASDQSLST